MSFSKDYITKLYMGCLRSCYDDYQLTQKTPVLTSFYKKMQRATFKMLENFHPSALNSSNHEMKEISWFDDKPKKMTFDDLFELAQESMRTMVATSFTMMCPFQRVKHSRDDLYQIYAECLYSCFEDYRRDKYHESFVDLFFNRMANVTLPWIIDFNGMP
ncbi:hypothetical protein [Lacticaseibacillus jixiensis]|uniref:hypothetical protein n=1 Tax=Lacticaseibacillus jixiensis TaxID=3231926 RepID=UPI0036F196CF